MSYALWKKIAVMLSDSAKQCPIMNVASFDNFRTIKKDYSMLVRFEIVD